MIKSSLKNRNGISPAVRILLVDDQPANLDVLEEILKPSGYVLDRTTSGQAALRFLLKNEYACCLLDIRMPEVDGFQIAEIIRKDPHLQYLPIIFVTAEAADQKSMFKGYEKGAVDFLIKPLEPIVIRSKVDIFANLYVYQKALKHSKEVENLNRQLGTLNRELQSANSDLEHFTHMAAHDLREPVRKQRNLVDLLSHEIPEHISESAKLLLNEIDRSSAHMIEMINDFRALTKIDYVEIKRSNLNLKNLIEECLVEYKDIIVHREVAVSFDEFPESISVYSSLVRRFYDNLIRNVFDHVHKQHFSIHFTAEKDEKGVWIFGVKNTGSNIPEDQLDQIFKMYRKLDPQSTDGSGIGLTICKRIVERHHGILKAESGPDSVHFKFTWRENENA